MIEIYDTTLRDGTQMKGISLSGSDKVRIAKRLDEFGVDFIEGGWPGSNAKDVEFFERAKDIEWQNAKIAAFGSTCRAKMAPEDDANIKALIDSHTEVCTLFGKSSVLHVKDVLRTTNDENLRMIEESCAYLKSQGRRVIYDAEHFFDGYKLDAEYAMETLRAAVRGGIETLVLADTNGGCLVEEAEKIIKVVLNEFDLPVGIHAHNDGGLAAAISLAAVRLGCTHVQGTMNGYGERCGNADLCLVIPNLELKMGKQCVPEGNLPMITELSNFINEIANMPPTPNKAFIGASAFAHKGGVHASAMRRNPDSYQHIDPELVGNRMSIVVSELAGRANLITKAENYGIKLEKEEEVLEVLDDIKGMEARGFSFEAAEASVAMMLKRLEKGYKSPFRLIDFTVNVEHREGRGILAEATVKVEVEGEVSHTAAEGNGPVNALDLALRKALTPRYPLIETFELTDYKVRILNSTSGTHATIRVLIDTENGNTRWSTVGASENVIEASWQALADSIEYGLMIGK